MGALIHQVSNTQLSFQRVPRYITTPNSPQSTPGDAKIQASKTLKLTPRRIHRAFIARVEKNIEDRTVLQRD